MDQVPCTYRISVKAIVKNDHGDILLLKGKDGEWELPGGGLEHGEDAKIALIREISEETALTVDWVCDQPAKFWIIQKDVGSPTLKWFAFVVYEVKVSGVFKPNFLSDEAQVARYFSVVEAKKLKLHDNTKPYFA